MSNQRPLVLSPSGDIQRLTASDSIVSASSAIGTTADPTTTSSSFVLIPEMRIAVQTQGRMILVLFDATFHIFGNDNFVYAIFIDNNEMPGTRRQVSCTFTLNLGILNIDNQQPSSNHWLGLPGTLSPGSHVFDVRWALGNGVARANSTQRRITVIEA